MKFRSDNIIKSIGGIIIEILEIEDEEDVFCIEDLVEVGIIG